MTDKLFKSADFAMRRKYIKLVESVKEHGGKVKIKTFIWIFIGIWLSSFCISPIPNFYPLFSYSCRIRSYFFLSIFFLSFFLFLLYFFCYIILFLLYLLLGLLKYLFTYLFIYSFAYWLVSLSPSIFTVFQGFYFFFSPCEWGTIRSIHWCRCNAEISPPWHW